jgi:hypothetical protein
LGFDSRDVRQHIHRSIVGLDALDKSIKLVGISEVERIRRAAKFVCESPNIFHRPRCQCDARSCVSEGSSHRRAYPSAGASN